MNGSRFAEIVRFLIAGLVNTLFTIAVFQVLITIVATDVAYCVTWLIGVSFVGLVYPTLVFGARRNWLSRSLVAAVYILTFIIGLCLFKMLNNLSIGPRAGIFIVLIVTTIVNYLGSRAAIAGIRRTPHFAVKGNARCGD